MKVKLEIWRQERRNATGQFESYNLDNASPDMSFWRCSTFSTRN